MKLKSAPTIGPRYWTAMLIASVCGTNVGDFVPDVLQIGTIAGLISLIALFIVIVMIDRHLKEYNEGLYWTLVLVVRAGATSIADLAIEKLHLGYLAASTVLALILVGVILHRRGKQSPAENSRLAPTGLYWATMLTAGALGTLVGDGLGHALGAVSKGVPVSASTATAALMLLYFAWRRLWSGAATQYWLTIVIVRWWGTNVGDILAFLLSLPISTLSTAVALALVVYRWPSSEGSTLRLGHGREPR